MRYLARGQSTGITNPVLTWIGLDVGSGLLLDPVELSLQIFDTSTTEKKLDPLEVLAETAVDLVTHRLRVGMYAPPWTVGASVAVGEYVARWRYTFEGGVETVVDETFEVLAKAPFQRGPMYSSIAEVRAQGLGSDSACTSLSDPTISALIIRASLRIELITGRIFEPRFIETRYDGSGSEVQRFNMPIIAFGGFTVDGTEIDATALAVYNRHLRGLAYPDDREDPRVASTMGYRFPRERQNVYAFGVFGYTDPSPASLWGITPPAISHVTRLLVARERDTIGIAQAPVGPIVEERTRDQSVKYGPSIADSFAANGWTGDPAIDQILVEYMRPAFVGHT